MPSLGQISKTLKVKPIVSKCLGDDAYRKLRHYGLKAQVGLQRSKTLYTQSTVNKETDQKHKSQNLPKSKGLRWTEIDPILPVAAYDFNFDTVADALDRAGITWWVIKGLHAGRHVIGVSESERADALEALRLSADTSNTPLYVMNAQGKNPQIDASNIGTVASLHDVEVLRIVSPRRSQVDHRKYGFAYGCDIEFWKLPSSETLDMMVYAPRENQASRILSTKDFEFSSTEIRSRQVRIPNVFTKTFLDECAFPIDAVYTWVDGDDVKWQESRLRLQAELSGEHFHPEAIHTARFRSRDELKYSLRSLEYFAPWFRKIFIVTADQIPEWLDVKHPKIQVVSHREIFEEKDLPTFNSNAIISRLHHIPDLSENYVYINDDVLFGKPVTKEQFFTPGGIALVSPSNNRRPFGPPLVDDGPHFNITRNIRSLLETEFGFVVSRAIKHTPHPMLKSVHFEMESRFPDTYSATCASRFRHHDDIVADQLHHYYAQIRGKATPGSLTYNYINILDDNYSSVLVDTLKLKDRDAFCINDAPVDGATPIDDKVVNEFFETYFPVKSDFEI
ncbi:stealth conserved region 3 domain-containing protein [Glutamicibacter protophormiae]